MVDVFPVPGGLRILFLSMITKKPRSENRDLPLDECESFRLDGFQNGSCLWLIHFVSLHCILQIFGVYVRCLRERWPQNEVLDIRIIPQRLQGFVLPVQRAETVDNRWESGIFEMYNDIDSPEDFADLPNC